MKTAAYILNPGRILMKKNPMLYGHFLAHFHRRIYGGIYDPASPFADQDVLRTDVLDVLPTRMSQSGMLAVAAVNKHASVPQSMTLTADGMRLREYRVITVNGNSPDAYNDIGLEQVTLTEGTWTPAEGSVTILLEPHSVNVIQLR